jgi:hypothetical protein
MLCGGPVIFPKERNKRDGEDSGIRYCERIMAALRGLYALRFLIATLLVLSFFPFFLLEKCFLGGKAADGKA